MTRVLWELICVLFGVSWVLSSSVRDTLLDWCDPFVGNKRKKVWQATPLCLFWTVWKAKNNIAFDDEVFSIRKLKRDFVCFLWVDSKLFLDDCPVFSWFSWMVGYFLRFLFYALLLEPWWWGEVCFLVHFELLISAALLF